MADIFAYLYGFGAGGDFTKSVIIVTAPTGSTVTCTKGTTVKTATEKNGEWWFKNLDTGTWTVKATLSGQTATQTVNVTQFGVYRVTMSYFKATIAVTYPAGSTCTCSKDGKTFTAPNTSGSHTFTVDSAGTWTVTITDGVNTESEQVTISTTGQQQTLVLKYRFWIFKSGVGAVVPLSYYKQTNGVYSVSTEAISQDLNGTASTTYTVTVARTSEQIDLTNYSEMVIDASCSLQGENAFNGRLAISKSAFTAESRWDVFAGSSKYTADGIRKLYLLDISAFNGTYYVGSWGATRTTIYNIYLR